MGLISSIELLLVLFVIGMLLLLGIRKRLRSHTVLLLTIIALLLLALIHPGQNYVFPPWRSDVSWDDGFLVCVVFHS